jgi:hypothetical protein
MGYKYSYDIVQALTEIRKAAHECSHTRTDGFVAWGIKQDLYQVKWMLDDLLKDCPTFGPEAEWLREQEQKKIIKILKNDIQ